MSSVFGGGGAEEAAEAQARAGQRGIEEQQRQFGVAQQQAAPFRLAGLSALQQQLALLGLPGITQEQAQAITPPPAPIITRPDRSAIFNARARARQLGIEFDPQKFSAGIPQGFEPGQALGPGQQRPGGFVPPPVTREEALAAFTESPGQQFLRERQERALLRSSSAIGGLGGGNIRTALQEQAFGRAQTDLSNQLNRLASLSGAGQTATGQLGQLGGQAAGQISALQQAGGQAQASGILGAQQEQAAQTQQLLGAGLGAAAGGGLLGTTAAGAFGGSAGAGALIGLLSDRRLKKNIVKIGQLDNGLNWYKFDWTDEGKRLAQEQDTEGVIAQEVQEVLPHAVTEGSDGFLRVNYKELR